MADKQADPGTGSTSTKQKQGRLIVPKTTYATKHELLLELLLERGDQGVYKLETLRGYGETCLSTTISQLKLRREIVFNKSTVEHIGRHGGKVYFRRYALAPESIQHAQTVLEELREGRTT